MSITPRPKHHRYMIQNRGLEPDHPDFYRHIHPVEDLLDYLEDIHANDDPVDVTMNQDFVMNIFSRRWGHKDRYNLRRIETGWHISMLPRSGDCDKSGQPILYRALDNDGVNYPESLPGYLEWLWDQCYETGLSVKEVQNALDQLAEWINVCEMNSPSGVFKGYK